MVTAFFGKLYTFQRHMEVTDCMLWNPSKRNICEVKSFFRMLSLVTETSTSLWRSIWKVKSYIASRFLCVDGDSWKDSDFGQLA